MTPRLPGMTAQQSLVLQLRAEGKSYRQVGAEVHLAPRMVHKIEQAALRIAVRYLQASAFLDMKNPA